MTHWETVDDPAVSAAIARAARKVHMHDDFRDLDDLTQEANIMVATSDRFAQLALDGSIGTLQYELERDLINLVRVDRNRMFKHVSAEVRYGREESDPRIAQPPPQIKGGYDTDLVKQLVPAIWDDYFAWGMQCETAPDSDMPRGTINKATGNTLAAYIADIRRAWELAPLTLRQRQVLFLLLGQGWGERECGKYFGATRQAVNESLHLGVQHLGDFLNGLVPRNETAFRLKPTAKDIRRNGGMI